MKHQQESLQQNLKVENLRWAATRQNQQSGMCAQRRIGSAWASAQSDQSLLSAWRKPGSLATYCVHSEDWSDWAHAPADPSLRWAHMPLCWFCHKVAQMSWPGCLQWSLYEPARENGTCHICKQQRHRRACVVWPFIYHHKILGWTSGFCARNDLPCAHWDETDFRRMSRLIWNSLGAQVILLILSCSNYLSRVMRKCVLCHANNKGGCAGWSGPWLFAA